MNRDYPFLNQRPFFGAVSLKKEKTLWRKKRVFFCTPGVYSQ